MTTLKQNPFLFGNLLDDFFPAQNVYYPPVNIFENEKSFTIELNVPGIKKEDIQIQMEKGMLTIQYTQPNNTEIKSGNIIKKEFAQKSFKRNFSLDEKINANAIDAVMENGILTLTLPIKENTVAPKTVISIK